MTVSGCGSYCKDSYDYDAGVHKHGNIFIIYSNIYSSYILY